MNLMNLNQAQLAQMPQAMAQRILMARQQQINQQLALQGQTRVLPGVGIPGAPNIRPQVRHQSIPIIFLNAFEYNLVDLSLVS
jgi:hypothetical protein